VPALHPGQDFFHPAVLKFGRRKKDKRQNKKPEIFACLR
jgi:hypothetical protein